MAERIDELLDQWKENFELETKQKEEMYAVLSKFDAQNPSRRFSIQNDFSSTSKNFMHIVRRQNDLEVSLSEKEEQIQQYEQKLEIHRAEINNCNINS